MKTTQSQSISKTPLVLAVIVFLFAMTLAIASLWHDAINVDEVPHIGAGYSYLSQADMRLNPEHPPLAKDVAALPLLFLHLKPDAFETRFWQSDVNGQWEFARRLIFNSGNNAETIAHAAKIAMLVFFVISTWYVFRWSRRLYGEWWAFVAVTLFCLSPTVLAHARFVTTDVPALFGVLFSTFYFLRYLKQPKGWSLVWAGLAFGIALLTKFSTVLLIPFFGLLALMWGALQAKGLKNKISDSIEWGLRSVLVMIIGVVLVVWPIYFLHVRHYPPERQRRDTESILQSFGNQTLTTPVIWASDKPVIRAMAQYSLGLLMVGKRSVDGNDIFFRGKVVNHGGPIYFPFVYFIKEPLAWWGLLLVVIIGYAARALSKKEHTVQKEHWLKRHFEEVAMLLWLIIYWAISIHSTLNIGVRHLLPVYPFTIILLTGQLRHLQEFIKNRIRHGHRVRLIIPGVVAILLAWYALEAMSVYPHYLAYFNEVAGGPAGGHKYVDDSNLDWGQELVRFSTWVITNDIPKIEFDYFGWSDPYYYLGDRYIYLNSTKYADAADFKARNQSDGWIAVSYTYLQRAGGVEGSPRYPNYDWLKSRTPVAIIGYSIYIYKI